MSLVQPIARTVAGVMGRESRFIQALRPVYESSLQWLSNGRGIAWNINGVNYRIDPHHRHQLGQNYDAQVADFLRTRVKPNTVCFDVGANVGVYVLQFAEWSKPMGRVVAFEPNPKTRVILNKHVALNHLEDRVTIVPAAVSAVVSEDVFYAADVDGRSRLGAPNHAIADKVLPISVTITTIDRYCAAEGITPDWLFIDIEGFEIAALIGARETIQRLEGDLGIVVEMHPNVWDSANTTQSEAEKLLSELKLKPIALTGQIDPLSEHGLVYLAWQ